MTTYKSAYKTTTFVEGDTINVDIINASFNKNN
jgi:hypothetical protein